MKPDNSHHELMNQMEEFAGSSRENDFLEAVAAASEAPSPAEELTVGPRVRQIRQAKGLSLLDLAQRTGLSEQALKDIEQGEASPPLGVLIKLGKALKMKLGTLIATGEERPYTVVRMADRMDMSRYPYSRQTSYGYSYQALAPQKSNRSMEPFLVTLRRPSAEVAPSAHDGEEFIFVLKGDMEARVGEASEILHAGDCIYYDSTQPHLVTPHGEGPTLILAVMYSLSQ